MFKIEDYLTDLNDNLKNIIMDKIDTGFVEYQRINIYNKNIKVPAQKIWISVPKLKIHNLFKPIVQKNESISVNIISLILHDNDPEIKKLKTFIKRLEKYISDQVLNKNPTIEIKSCICETNTAFPLLYIPISYNKKNDKLLYNFNIFNHLNKRIDVSDLEELSGYSTKILLELNYVWINDKKFGLNWKILQMKLYPEYNFNNCIFDPDQQFQEEEEKIISQKNIYVPIQTLTTDNIDIPKPPPINKKDNTIKSSKTFIPTINDLLSTMKKLRPINSTPNIIVNKNKISETKNIKNYETLILEMELELLNKKTDIDDQYNKIINLLNPALAKKYN